MEKRLRGVAASLALVACLASIFVGAAPAAASGVTMSVDRTSGLLNGQLVSVSGSGLAPQSLGDVLECSNVPGQPTVSVEGFAVAVSCNSPEDEPGYPFAVGGVFDVQADGTVSTSLVVHTGIVGPPTLGIDSAGHNTAADAALYPCPPTPAQQAQGASCVLELGDAQGDSASTPISFAAPLVTTPSVVVSPPSGLSTGNQVSVSGTGFTPDSPWLAIECNVTPGEPTAAYGETNLPVGCDQASAEPTSPGAGLLGGPPVPVSSVTDSSGAFGTSLTIAEGNIGGTQQSASYPCPPSPANVAAGGKCAIVVEDGAAEEASAAIAITGPVPVPSITVTPSTNLSSASVVQITGEGFVPNQIAGLVECNFTTGEPTVLYDGIAVPVSCSQPKLLNTSSSGGLSASFQITEGQTGPPSPGTDSAGNPASADAALYPCPPTAAQQAAGSTCGIAAGDLQGDMVNAPISFASFPGCTGASGDTAFLCALYIDLLGRPADSSGLALWQSQLAAGTSRSQVAYMLLTSQEYRTNLVEGYYQQFLGREADPGGLSTWVGSLDSGADDQSVLEGLLGSDEFYSNTGGFPEGFVISLYRDLLDRPPDIAGLEGWTAQLAAGASRSSVVSAFLGSNEYLSRFVQTEYLKLLGRPADSAGLSTWVGDLAAGASFESVIAAIAGSTEYYSLNS